jgi:hypothetical protein
MKKTFARLRISKTTISNLQWQHTIKGGIEQVITDITKDTRPSVCPSFCPPPSAAGNCETQDASCVQSCYFNTCYDGCMSLRICIQPEQ